MNSYAHSLYKTFNVFFTALLLLLLTQYSHAAITIGSASQQQAKTSSINFNHTLASGTNRIIVVGVSIEGNGNIGRTTSITYAGVAMHVIPSSLSSLLSSGFAISSELFYLTDTELPASGSQTIQITHDGTNINAGALQLNGVVQGNPEAVATNAIKSPSSISASINTLTANTLILDVAAGGHPDDRAQLAANAAQTSFWGTSASSSQGGGSTRQVGAAGNYTQQWGTNGMNRAALSVVAFAPADGGTPVNQPPVLNSIGNQTIQEGVTQVITISATDPDGDALNFSSPALPNFASLVDNGNGTATLTLTPQIGDAGSSNITITVTDPTNTPVSETFSVDIAMSTSGKLNDTGITTCGDYAFDAAIQVHNQDIDCTLAPGTDGEGDPIPDGQDGQVVVASNFTKISATGDKLPESANEWACVRDNTTGFMWEAKTTSGLHSKDDQYMWYDPTAPVVNGFSGQGYQKPSDAYLNPSYSDTTIDGYFDFRGQDDTLCADAKGSAYPVANCNMFDFSAKVNEEQLCGITGWRVPERDELRTLVSVVDMSTLPSRLPSTSATYFPNTLVSKKILFSGGPRGRGVGYALSETAVTQTNKSWIIYFGDIEVDHEVSKQELRYVRLVNGDAKSSSFTVSTDGLTVADSKTGLTWKRCVEGYSTTISNDCVTDAMTQSTFTWKEAMDNTGQSYAGKSDWRVPNLNELASLPDLTEQYPAINEAVFPGTPTSNPVVTWTSSIHLSNGARAWAISFDNGGDRKRDKNVVARTRLVRDTD
ncbi:MAG: DUF1566 domain-containing protein [Thiotrichaceae bacterium]